MKVMSQQDTSILYSTIEQRFLLLRRQGVILAFTLAISPAS